MGMRYKGDILNRLTALQNRFENTVRGLENGQEVTRENMTNLMRNMATEMTNLYEMIEIEQDDNKF